MVEKEAKMRADLRGDRFQEQLPGLRVTLDRFFYVDCDEKRRYRSGPGDVQRLAFSPDLSLLAVVNEHRGLLIWDTQTKQQVLGMERSTIGQVLGLKWSPDGKRLAAQCASNARSRQTWYSDRRLLVLSIPAGQILLSMPGVLGPVAWSRDGSLLSSVVPKGFTENTEPGTHDVWEVKIWEAVGGKEVLSIPRRGLGGSQLSFSPDGKQLAHVARGDEKRPGTLTVWNVSNGASLPTAVGANTSPRRLWWTPDGNALVWGRRKLDSSGRQLDYLWELSTGRERLPYLAGEPGQPALAAALSADGGLLAAGANYYVVYLHDIAKEKATTLHFESSYGGVRGIYATKPTYLAFAQDNHTLGAVALNDSLVFCCFWKLLRE
jgi:WD40 repeat protein